MSKNVFRLLFCLAAFTSWCVASSFSGTLTNLSGPLTWNGTETGVLGETQTGTGLFNPPCDATLCDIYTLTVNIPAAWYAANPYQTIHVKASWASTLNEVDVYVYDAAGNNVGMATFPNGTNNDADLGQLPNGVYTIQMVPTVMADTPYTGTVYIAQEPTIASGTARYRRGNAAFSTQKLTRPPQTFDTTQLGTLFFNQDAEPRVVHDGVGNLYTVAIQGVPSGTDLWTSQDAGNTWNYGGQPDGVQAAAKGGYLVGAGAGGGDEDVITLPNGNVVMTSLWLGSNTTCKSFDSAATWVCNPNGSTLPADDRQWLANYGNNIVYITSKQLGADLGGTDSIYVAKSIDGGLTFPIVSQITKPELGLQPGDQGNILVDQNNGNVYNVFFDSTGQQLYLAKSVDGGTTWMLKLVYQATPGASLVHVFPAVALDKAGNLYIVFCDGVGSYLTTSTNGGASWTPPVRINAGLTDRTSMEPWVVAGDVGKINVFYYGTTTGYFDSPDADWRIFMAQSLNALAPVPTFSISQATDVMHHGGICNNGLACQNGTRNLLEYFYPDTYTDGTAIAVYPDDLHVDKTTTITNVWILKQTGGSGLIGK